MLTEREVNILKYLEKKRDRFVTTIELANNLAVSVRTIKSDIKNIQSVFKSESTIELKSVRAKGMMLEYTDNKRFNELLEDNIGKNNLSRNEPNNRVSQLLLNLLDNKMSRIAIQHQFNVSESTVNTDLKNIESILKRYDLKLGVDSSKKIKIIGDEKHKRKLIGQYKNVLNLNKENMFYSIENIVLNILMDEEYNVTEQVFNNILIHIQISINRIISGKVIEEYNELSEKWNRQLKVARRLLGELGQVFNFEINEGEVANFAILLAGKSDYENQNYIPDEISNFVDLVLIGIDEAFNVNFSDQMENKLNLSLHVIPLLERLKHKIQLPSDQADYVRQAFPIAFDISAFFSLEINRTFDLVVTENELSYLAIHFNKFLIESDAGWGKKAVLIISNIRRSESILLKQRFLTWFKEEITNVEVASYSEIKKIELDKYDVIFSTDDDSFTSQYAPIIISKFPKDNDYLNLKLAIDGFQGKQDILTLFKEELFFIDHLKHKEDIFTKFYEMTSTFLGDYSESFIESVKAREEMSNTYFSNEIAFPHPVIPFSKGSFVSVVLLKEPIVWNEDLDKVRIVMLVSIEKNNAKSFQLWNYLSGLTKDLMFSFRLKEVETYEDFMSVLELSIKYN